MSVASNKIVCGEVVKLVYLRCEAAECLKKSFVLIISKWTVFNIFQVAKIKKFEKKLS
jgi:hypothetical protein